MQWKEIPLEQIANVKGFVPATLHYDKPKEVYLVPVETSSPSTDTSEQPLREALEKILRISQLEYNKRSHAVIEDTCIKALSAFPVPVVDRKEKEEILHDHVKNIYLFNHSNEEKREELKSAIYAAMDEYAASHLTGKGDWVKIETDANLPLAEDVCLWIHIPNEYYPHCGSMLDEDFPGIDKFNYYFKITNEFFPKPIP